MPSITITTTTAEAQRMQAWATASNYPDVKTLVIQTMKQGLAQFESSLDAQQFADGYTPIAPT